MFTMSLTKADPCQQDTNTDNNTSWLCIMFGNGRGGFVVVGVVFFFFFNPSKQHLNSSQTVFVSKTWIDDLFTEHQAETGSFRV